jgi:hypothetical protein
MRLKMWMHSVAFQFSLIFPNVYKGMQVPLHNTRDSGKIEARILGIVIVGGIIIVFGGSIVISLWADSSGYAGIGISIAQAIAAVPIAIGTGLAGIITHYLNPLNW